MHNINQEICASILIGGKSSRMGGGIKSLIKYNNRTIFDRIYQKLNLQIKNIIINTNETKKELIEYNLPLVEDKISGHLGPLSGIHSSLIWINKKMKRIKWLISIPGDTPFIPNNLVEKLYLKAVNNKKEIVMVKHDNKIHPVIGIWDVKLLNSIENNLLNEEGERKIILWAKNHNLDYVEIIEKNYDPFFNINTKNDLFIAKEIEEKFIIK